MISQSSSGDLNIIAKHLPKLLTNYTSSKKICDLTIAIYIHSNRKITPFDIELIKNQVSMREQLLKAPRHLKVTNIKDSDN